MIKQPLPLSNVDLVEVFRRGWTCFAGKKNDHVVRLIRGSWLLTIQSPKKAKRYISKLIAFYIKMGIRKDELDLMLTNIIC